MNEIWRHDCRSENTSNNVFHFRVNLIELEFQLMGFLMYDFFVRFVQKSAQTVISTLKCQNVIEKKEKSFDFLS